MIPRHPAPRDAYAPQLPITMSQTHFEPHDNQGSLCSGPGLLPGGSPADTALDVKKIEGVQWQMTTPLLGDGSATECAWDITLTNVKFYK